MDQIKSKILVVDHKDSYFLGSVVDILTEAGYNVDSCSDAETTYRKTKTSVRPFDLLIIDLGSIQDTDGFIFLKVLKTEAFCKELKVIITSNSLIDNRLSEAQSDLAICAFFNKTRPFEEILYVVGDILPPGGQNLRKFRRIPVRFLVKYVVDGNSQVHYASNLSQEGIFIRNSRPDPVGTIVHLSFDLSKCRFTLEVKARVVRVVRYDTDVSSLRYETFPPGNGLVFLEMPKDHRCLLEEFMDRENARIFGSRQ